MIEPTRRMVRAQGRSPEHVTATGKIGGESGTRKEGDAGARFSRFRAYESRKPAVNEAPFFAQSRQKMSQPLSPLWGLTRLTMRGPIIKGDMVSALPQSGGLLPRGNGAGWWWGKSGRPVV